VGLFGAGVLGEAVGGSGVASSAATTGQVLWHPPSSPNQHQPQPSPPNPPTPKVKRQMEEDADREMEDLKEKYEARLGAER